MHWQSSNAPHPAPRFAASGRHRPGRPQAGAAAAPNGSCGSRGFFWQPRSLQNALAARGEVRRAARLGSPSRVWCCSALCSEDNPGWRWELAGTGQDLPACLRPGRVRQAERASPPAPAGMPAHAVIYRVRLIGEQRYLLLR